MAVKKKVATKKKVVKKKAPAKKKVVTRKKSPAKKARGPGRHGGTRRNSGRKEGAATKKTREIADKLAESDELTPLEYMLQVLRTGHEVIKARREAGEIDDAEYLVLLKAHMERRDWAAEKAAPYIHPRLASIEQKGAGGGHEDWTDIINEGIEAGKQV